MKKTIKISRISSKKFINHAKRFRKNLNAMSKKLNIEKSGYTISIGELIDRISIVNVKMWHLDAGIAEANKKGDNNTAGVLAGLARDQNRERSDLREEINMRLEGKSRGTNKIEYAGVGR